MWGERRRALCPILVRIVMAIVGGMKSVADAEGEVGSWTSPWDWVLTA